LTAGEIKQSILNPDAVVSWEYWSISAHTQSGEPIRGIRLNEDTASVQFRDETGRLRSLLKKDLKDYEIVRKSPMPSFQSKLSAQQVDDIIAYLIRGQQ